MNPIAWFLIGMGISFFQGSLEVAWSFRGPAPDLLLVYVLFLGIRRETGCALLVGFFGGLVQGTVDYVYPLGLLSLCKVVTAFIPEWAHVVFVSENRMTGFLLVIFATLIHQLILYSIVQTFEPGGVWGGQAIFVTLALIGWNLLIWLVAAQRFLPSSREDAVA